MRKILKKTLVYLLLFGELFQTTGVYALTKEENVYAKLNETGEVKNISITEHLFDYNGTIINDKSSLKDIKNMNGNEKFTVSGNDLLWNTNQNHIYYTGKYDKELPISMNVKYYLDGKEVNVKDILGKKGHITIAIDYKNNISRSRNINGKIEELYVPYMVATTTILNNSDCKNIKVTNGKIMDNGISSVVIGVSFPGLYESLRVNELKDMNHVEISYDTESFELNSIYSVATTDLLDNNLNIASEVNNLYQSIDLLQSNMNTIVDASKKLSDGSSKMDTGITELNKRIQKLTQKYQYYRNLDKNTLKEELIKMIEKNINTITPALEEEVTNEASKIIKENKEELESAVITYTKKNTKSVVDDEVNRIVNKLDMNGLMEKVMSSNLYNVLINDNEILELSNTLKEEISSDLKNIVASEFNKINDSINNSMSDVEQEQYVKNISEKYGVTYEQALGIVGEVRGDTLNQVKKSISDANITDEIVSALNNKDTITHLVNNYMNQINQKLSEALSNDIKIDEYAKELKKEVLDALSKDLENEELYLNKDVGEYISGLVNRIIDNTSRDLASKYTEEYTNQVVKNVVNRNFSDENVDSILRNILNEYEDDINKKATVLDETIHTLSDSFNRLNNGSKQLSSGMNTLSLGLEKYNQEGINKISSLVNGDVKTLQERLKSLIQLSDENKMIDSMGDDSKGNSKIIFMIDSISKPEETKNKVKKEEKKETFFDKVKGLFY